MPHTQRTPHCTSVSTITSDTVRGRSVSGAKPT
jgi:hypothetical protein